jgi:hypothetical protein
MRPQHILRVGTAQSGSAVRLLARKRFVSLPVALPLTAAKAVSFGFALKNGTRSVSSTVALSDEVHADGSITFRYRDTGAERVEVSVEGLQSPIAMTKVDGLWSVTTPPLRPETCWYWFIVDGQAQTHLLT